ncbi:MAG: GFA family protein [Rhodobiaceae bacterium]|nr:GFA family protein [Rhodobiaceae bacterium]
MKVEGGCYCGELRYEVEGDALFKAQCHCRECQYISGGSPNVTMGMPESAFKYTKGTPKSFKRTDIDPAVTREFCGNCGTSMLSRAPGAPGMVLLKVGSMDDPKLFEGPQVAIYTCDAQDFHMIPEGVASFDRLPG